MTPRGGRVDPAVPRGSGPSAFPHAASDLILSRRHAPASIFRKAPSRTERDTSALAPRASAPTAVDWSRCDGGSTRLSGSDRLRDVTPHVRQGIWQSGAPPPASGSGARRCRPRPAARRRRRISPVRTSTSRSAKTPMDFTGSPRVAVTVNGSVPAPTLRWREGDTVTVRVANRLRDETSVHWHGILLPANMDGVPGLSFDGIRPGETFVYRFRVRQGGTVLVSQPLGVPGNSAGSTARSSSSRGTPSRSATTATMSCCCPTGRTRTRRAC